MQPLEFFRERIGSKILRGTTVVEVTEENHQKLFEVQDPKKNYVFTDYSRGPLDK